MREVLFALLAMVSLLVSCAGGGGTAVYGHYYGVSPWWDSRDYYGDNIIVVPPDRGPDVEATPLPSGSEALPDIGSPDF